MQYSSLDDIHLSRFVSRSAWNAGGYRRLRIMQMWKNSPNNHSEAFHLCNNNSELSCSHIFNGFIEI